MYHYYSKDASVNLCVMIIIFFSIIISNKTKYYCNRNFSIENMYKKVDNRQHMLFYLYKYSMDH